MEKFVCTSLVLYTGIVVLLGCDAWMASGTQHTSVQSLRFFVFGDWGGLPDFPYRTPIEMAIAKRMGEFAHNLDTQFLLALGDNFYFDGVKDENDKRFYETFESVFTEPALMRPWYIIAGNHDWNGNASAQIAYSKHSSRWKYPAFYYPLLFDIPGTNQTVEILMIDTVILCGNSDADNFNNQPSLPAGIPEAEKQWAWIEKSLRTSKAEYLLVAGHYPVYSIAMHGNTKCLLSRLKPMLHKFRATAYICGHEHNLQHIEWTDEQYETKVQYFVTGAADFIDPKFDHWDDMPGPHALRFHWADIFSLGAFSYVKVTATNMTFQFIRTNGKLLYEQVMLPRRR